MKEINLTQGKVTLVDDSDFDALNQFKWYANKNGNTFYAVRAAPFGGKQIKIYMHIAIMNGKGIDHIDHNGLNNQRTNLRLVTRSQNFMNREKWDNTTSIYKGVCWHKPSRKWAAQIRINSTTIYLGIFKDEVDAARAYNDKAMILFTEFANLNTI